MSRDTWTILGLSWGSVVLVVAVAVVVLQRVRRLSLTTVFVVAGLTPVLALAAATAVNVRAMFLSAHDTTVTLLTLAAGLPVTVLTALLLGRWVTRGSVALATSVGRLTSGEAAGAEPVVVPRELAVVAAELADARSRLAAAREEQEAVHRSHQELISFLSHDLRTPLAGIRALAEGLEDGVLDDVPAALAGLRGGVDRLDGMVSDLFELSRGAGAAPGTTRRDLETVDLREVVGDVVADLEPLAHRHGVRLVVAVTGRPRLPADSEALTRALTNLVANALRHTGSGGVVEVSGGSTTDGAVRLSVRDECGGIPPEDLERVFDVGWRGQASRGPADGGAGLGLAIVRQVAHAHSGAVAVRNVSGGCAFDLVLPAGPPPVPGVAAP